MAELLQTQADQGISECLKYIETLGTQRIIQFFKYLKNFRLLKIEIQTRGLDKRNIMKQIKDNITIKDHETCETILRWVEMNKQNLPPKAIQKTYKKMLQYSLEELFHPRVTRNLSKRDRKHLLQCLTANKHLRIKEEQNDIGCIYWSISHSFESIDRIFEADEIRSKCLSFLKDKTIPLEPEQIKAILRSQSPMHDHVSKLAVAGAPGDPFIFYAAAKVYKVHIHVISAVSNEEYMFYPDILPSERADYDHINIGHLHPDYYTGLVNNVSMEVLMQQKQDLESRMKDCHDQIVQLQSQVNNLEGENARLKSNDNVKLTKDLNDKLQESEKMKQMLEDENKQLKSKLESIRENYIKKKKVEKAYIKKEEVKDLLKKEVETNYVKKDEIEKNYVKKDEMKEFIKKTDVEALIYKITGVPRYEKETSNCNDPKPKKENTTETQRAQAPRLPGDISIKKENTTSTPEKRKSPSKQVELHQHQTTPAKEYKPPWKPSPRLGYSDQPSTQSKKEEMTPVEQSSPKLSCSKFSK